MIDKDAILQIKFRPDFYQRLVNVFKSTYEGKSTEDLERAAKQMEDRKIEEDWILNYETMLFLIRATEDYAKANNFVKSVDLDEYLNQENPQ